MDGIKRLTIWTLIVFCVLYLIAYFSGWIGPDSIIRYFFLPIVVALNGIILLFEYNDGRQKNNEKKRYKYTGMGAIALSLLLVLLIFVALMYPV